MIAVTDMHYRHPHAAVAVLNGMSFQAKSGQLTAILGPNGSGKTTLFKCISSIWKPQRGDVMYGGESILGTPHSKIARIIAVVPQEHEPPFPYSVLEAVSMGRAAHLGMFSVPSRSDYSKAEEAIARVGVAHLKDRPYTRISGGERQLVLIARALAQEAPVMLLDEPTSHLDFKNQVLVLKKVKEIAEQRKVTALMTIHDPNLAMLFCDRVVMINNGCVVSQGAAHEVITEENLSQVYGIDVSVVPVNGWRVIMPRLCES
ncbi:ABC transporter ATP-binding protein [Desulfomonile tiedjei]|uniref:ABC-type cobalamin/Fe3+-siderophore transport system, ATPase component n=1 Tax=Desulfomonile tiedjei (strain ATCC 49306 / DSM 6799 / DCB-1) TaxID=706587 RepID=I4CEQ9_DESTA|nr:ABC transporter ATP-binding protein [Desulfomonile tiedjei]AFM28050.1 ABC-type cobalamin/Fe3+-siderophore transport system, ATPase component [Desulfomonile tiedjei DSM 6799]